MSNKTLYQLLFILWLFLLVPGMTIPAAAQATANCTGSVLNHAARVKQDGGWVLPNVPANRGPVRARAACVENGITRKAEQHQDKQTLVTLKGIFKHSQDKEEKQTIASKVLRLGEKDDEYWHYLVHYATTAVESQIPNPIAVNEKGKGIRGQLSAEFLTWCDKNKCVPGEAAAAALYRLPADVLFLGMAKDPRAYDLFVRGLQSENYMIIHASAMSLANLQDKRAIPLLIQTTRRVPGIGEGIVETALIYFDDPEAQAEVRRLIPDEKALESARMSAKGIPIQKFIEVFALRFRDVPQ